MTADPDKRLREIVTRIEKSPLSTREKLLLYQIIRESMHSLMFPVIAKHISGDQLKELEKNLNEVTPEKFLALAQSALVSPGYYTDMYKVTHAVLDACDEALKKQGL